ncbi:MAG: RIP metalloprotease RseP [Desulfatibacillaceae bacterium]|nr:RIP metalloprotease RseP [Desulfatibacillaceae bacterium]
MFATLFVFILVLGLLVFAHELGHFLFARLFKVGVETFSLGFGPRLFGFKRGMTDYRVSAVPLGGYVKMVGEDPGDDISPEKAALSFSHKPVFVRAFIAAFGPLFNLLLALVIFWMMFQLGGLRIMSPVIEGVSEDSPAAVAGMEAQDTVLSINGKKVKDWSRMAELIANSNGRPLQVEVLRDEKVISFLILPDEVPGRNILGEAQTNYRIGVEGGQIRKPGPIEAFVYGSRETWEWVRLTGWFVSKMFTGTVPIKAMGGPIQIARETGRQARAGIVNLFYLVAVLSVNLALINLLPIPILDGGHLLFLAIEAIRKKPVSIKVREISTQVGLALLVGLMMVVFYNDFMRVRDSGNVIFVDDEKSSIAAHRLRLESAGKSMIQAGSVERILIFLEENPNEKVDAIILSQEQVSDIDEATRKIKELRPDIAIIAIAAEGHEEDLPDTPVISGLFAWLYHPLEHQDILGALEQARKEAQEKESVQAEQDNQ